MYRLHVATLLVLAVLRLEVSPASAASAAEHHHTQTARIAALLDLQGAQSSIGRPAMNRFVLGLQRGSDQGLIPFSALIDTKSDPEVTASAAKHLVSRVSFAAGFTDNDSVLIAGPFFQHAKVPFLSIGATDPALPKVVGNSIFLTPFGDNT